MSKAVALIIGIAGQDGSYLSEHLLNQGYEVHGLIRRQSTAENQESRLDHLSDKIHTYYGDLLDTFSLSKIVKTVNPTHIFNLGAMSHVKISFDVPSYTIQTNALGVLNILEIYKDIVPTAKFYQASSSEMFGNIVDSDGFQRETTIMSPVSPYGCSKLLGYNLVRHYRNAYNLHACNGILFNHESPRRGINFVTNKVAKAVAEIKLGYRKILELGNMDSSRDWGHSKDYTMGMIKIINHTIADDFVLSTGKTHTVRELCDVAFSCVGLNYNEFVIQNQKYCRPEELKYLKGDCTKAKTTLNWEPDYTFESMISEMVFYWIEKIQK